jgi:oxygen-dependent protoporphyrinogen oxidase
MAAQNRFIYYPDHLVRMPGPGGGVDIWQQLWSLYSEPVFSGLGSAVFGEIFREKRPSDIEDESLGAFIERRFGGPDLANNLVSAVLHGIYAGDIWQLSTKSLLPKMWWMEEKFGSIARALSSRLNDKVDWMPEKDFELMKELKGKLISELDSHMGKASVFTFKRGIGQLATSMEDSLKSKPNVSLKPNQKIRSVAYVEDGDKIEVCISVFK